MSISITISDVKLLDVDLWKASLEPREVKSLTTGAKRTGDASVVLVNKIDSSNGDKIQFTLGSIEVLIIGRTSTTYFICSNMEHRGKASAKKSNFEPNEFANSDDAFRSALRNAPEEVRKLGESFIDEARKHFRGTLTNTKSGKFVEKPDNYWTVKIQPRDKSLAITVRGEPDKFSVTDQIELKRDRPGYSRFKIRNTNQILSAISIIRQAERHSQ